MNFLSTRLSISSEDSAEKIAKTFFESIAAGRLEKAREASSSKLQWFGLQLGPEAWSKKIPAFIKENRISVVSSRSISIQSMTFAPKERQEELLDGPIAETDRVALVDLKVGKQVVTAAVVIDTSRSKPVVTRIFEPTAYAKFLSDLKGAIAAEA
jgi:hypothetical protein